MKHRHFGDAGEPLPQMRPMSDAEVARFHEWEDHELAQADQLVAEQIAKDLAAAAADADEKR
jgi:hypothetical protein